MGEKIVKDIAAERRRLGKKREEKRDSRSSRQRDPPFNRKEQGEQEATLAEVRPRWKKGGRKKERKKNFV